MGGSGNSYVQRIGLLLYIFTDRLNFRSVNKRALHANHFRIVENKHIAASYQMLCPDVSRIVFESTPEETLNDILAGSSP